MKTKISPVGLRDAFTGCPERQLEPTEPEGFICAECGYSSVVAYQMKNGQLLCCECLEDYLNNQMTPKFMHEYISIPENLRRFRQAVIPELDEQQKDDVFLSGFKAALDSTEIQDLEEWFCKDKDPYFRDDLESEFVQNRITIMSDEYKEWI